MEMPDAEKKETKDERLSTAKDLVEVLGRVILGGLALCYGLGLIIVNIYYSRYGVYSLSLFRLNYVVAGLWVLLPLISMSVICFGIIVAVVSIGPQSLLPTLRHILFLNQTSRFARAFLSIGFVALAIQLNYVVIQMFGITLNSETWIAFIMAAFTLVFCVLSIFYVVYREREPYRVMQIVLTALSVFLVYIFLFSQKVYEGIPAHLGGGGTKDVRLLLELGDKDKEFFQRSGLSFDSGSNWTENTELLFTTEDEFVVVVRPDASLKGRSSLSIKRDLIKSILYKGLSEPSSDSETSRDANPPSSPTTPAQTSPSVSGTSPNPSPLASPAQ